eukprot:gene9850-3100_t
MGLGKMDDMEKGGVGMDMNMEAGMNGFESPMAGGHMSGNLSDESGNLSGNIIGTKKLGDSVDKQYFRSSTKCAQENCDEKPA